MKQGLAQPHRQAVQPIGSTSTSPARSVATSALPNTLPIAGMKAAGGRLRPVCPPIRPLIDCEARVWRAASPRSLLEIWNGGCPILKMSEW
jgi:hypothetical protein